MPRSMLVLGAVAGAVVLASPGPIGAAELLSPTRGAHVHYAHVRASAGCGYCGCLHVAYVRHRELRSTYGLKFDPRDYDTAEPRYFYGRVRSYPRYFVEGSPVASVPGSC